MRILRDLILLLSLLNSKLALADAYGYYPKARSIWRIIRSAKDVKHLSLLASLFDGVYQTDKLGATGDQPTDPSKAVAISTEFSVKEVKTRQELYDYLHVSASVSGTTVFSRELPP